MAALRDLLDAYGWFRFRFRWKLPDGTAVLEGTDFGRVGDDGKLALIVVFVDSLPLGQA